MRRSHLIPLAHRGHLILHMTRAAACSCIRCRYFCGFSRAVVSRRYQFNADLFVARRVRVLELDTAAFRARSVGGGEKFVLGRHEQGTEVKAVTYSAMRITQADGRVDVLVIVDI